ncbi:ATP-binding cassette domain-containing protein, partial [Streptomyces sp. SID10244]|nr:ATP-binding cassette domain-containing protein [Streptomyces sp. SID10244]
MMTPPARPTWPTGVDIAGLSKVFPAADGPVRALDNVTLGSARGSFLSLLGPSGCGKSTILRMLAGLDE